MATELKKIGNSEYEVEYVVKDAELKTAKDKALKKLSSKVSIKGFRKGKAPLNMIKEHISPADLINETISQSLQPAYDAILKEHKLVPVDRPNINVKSYKDDEIVLVFNIDVTPEVTLGEYKNIDIPETKCSVSKAEVKEAIDKLLSDNSDLVLKEGAAEMGDTVVFDFKGYMDGKEFEGGSADNYSLVLGSNQFIPGFEDQLVGVTSESKKDVIVTFPEQYIKDLAGKEAKFVCMIHEIKTKQLPELNDDFAKSLKLKGVETVADLEKYESDRLLNQKKNSARNERFNKLLNTIISNSKIELSEKLISKEAENAKNQMLQQIAQNGLTFEQYKEITGTDEKELDKTFKENAEENLKRTFVLNKIAETEHLMITKADIEEYYSNLSSLYGMKVEDIKKALAQNESNIITNLFQNKIESFLEENNFKKEEKEPKKSIKKENKEDAKEKE